MEGTEELLTCKICMERYDDADKKPLFVPCGHTFCAKCLRFIYKHPHLKCPLDKKSHEFKNFALIPTNFSILNYLASQSQQDVRFVKRCQLHPKEAMKFFCEDEQALMCQDCFLESHLGHKVVSSEGML